MAKRNEPLKEWRDDGCPSTESKSCVQGFLDATQRYPSENHASMYAVAVIAQHMFNVYRTSFYLFYAYTARKGYS